MDNQTEVTPDDMILDTLARAEMGLVGPDLDSEWMVRNGPLGRQARGFGSAAGRETARLQRQGKSNRIIMRETLQFQAEQYATFVAMQGWVGAQLLARLVDLTGRSREDILAELKAEREDGTDA